MSYDCNGNLTGDGTWAFAYDPENHIVSATSAGASASCAYDPLGRRQTKTVGATITNFLDDGDDEIAEYDSSGNVLRRYVPGPGINQPIAMVTGSGATLAHQYIRANHQGSVIDSTNDAGTRVEGPIRYDPFGNCVPASQCNGGTPYRFTGMRLDAESGLYYDRARYYSSPLGRFLQTDPIGYKDDLDLYTYVGNDPTDKTDPSGQFVGWDDLAVLGSGAVGGLIGQGLSDVSTGHYSGWQSYVGSAAGGAVTAEGTYYAAALTGGLGAGAGFVASGAAGGATGEAVTEALKGESLDGEKIGIAAGIGAITNVPGGVAIKGLNAGKNSIASVAKAATTKLAKGEIKNISAKTAAKIGVAGVVNGTNAIAATGAAAVTKNVACSANGASKSTVCK